MENKDERKRQRRSSARPWNGPTRWERTSRRQRPPNKASSIISADIYEKYSAQFDGIETAYPESEFVFDDGGFWLLTRSELFVDDPIWVGFITAVPYSDKYFPRSWGFWDGLTWIGPRHTNFPDGSVCSFEIQDRTWLPGDSLVSLIDLHTLWSIRHLHLKVFGSWPGKQSVHIPYERLLEFVPTELCGCNKHPVKTYSECCSKRDASINKLAAAISFHIQTNGGTRNPPEYINKFLYQACDLPPVNYIYQ